MMMIPHTKRRHAYPETRDLSMSRPAFRWSVAVVVTVTAFPAATWVRGEALLTMRDAGARWGIAGGLGVAVAALAALWGHSYAAAEPGTSDDEHGNPQATADAHDGITRNTIRGGTFMGPVLQGRDFGDIDIDGRGTQAGRPPEAGRPPDRDDL
jgi:CubicO group peptidase (beta-lactamase class C family)